MRDRANSIFDLSPLHRPVWWAALALLLVNDNLLKGGGVAPGWLTGKLSDFAFLIVAPVLLLALLPRRLPHRRPLALSAVALVYSAAELSAAVSDLLLGMLARMGVSWRLWPDVTDLVALLVLPLTWWAMRPTDLPATAVAPAARPRPLLESAGVFIGALACLATSPLPENAHAPFIVNQTTQPRQITATWLLQPVPCEGDLLAGLAATLNPRDLKDPHTATLASGDVAVLGDLSPGPGQPLSNQCPAPERSSPPPSSLSSASCTGVIIQASSELAVLAAFPRDWFEFDNGSLCGGGDNFESKCKPHFGLREDPGPDALALREQNGKLVFNVDLDSRVQVVTVSLAAIAARPDPRGTPAGDAGLPPGDSSVDASRDALSDRE